MEVDLGDLGAFLDTTGSNKPKKSKASKEESDRSDGEEEILYETGVTSLYKDEVESRLESLVFGNQSFTATTQDLSDTEQRDKDSVRPL